VTVDSEFANRIGPIALTNHAVYDAWPCCYILVLTPCGGTPSSRRRASYSSTRWTISHVCDAMRRTEGSWPGWRQPPQDLARGPSSESSSLYYDCGGEADGVGPNFVNDDGWGSVCRRGPRRGLLTYLGPTWSLVTPPAADFATHERHGGFPNGATGPRASSGVMRRCVSCLLTVGQCQMPDWQEAPWTPTFLNQVPSGVITAAGGCWLTFGGRTSLLPAHPTGSQVIISGADKENTGDLLHSARWQMAQQSRRSGAR
jgi:hypothetical protein